MAAPDPGLPSDGRSSDVVSRAFCDHWLDADKTLAMWVPSHAEPSEVNLFINADHPQITAVELVKERDSLEFDLRLS